MIKSNIENLFSTIKTLAVSGLMVFVVAACGGSGGGDDDPSTTTESANGIWRGTVTNTTTGYTSNAYIGLLFDGEAYFYDPNSGEMDVGTYSITGNQFSGNFTAYQDGVAGPIATGTVSATVRTETSISGSFSNSLGHSGSISLAYDNLYDRGVTLADSNDIWMYTNGFYTLTLSIGADGVITGSDTDGCNYAGNLSLADPGKNLYSTQLSVTNCGAENGTYTGFGVLGDTVTTNDTFTFAVQSASYIIYISFDRQ